MAEPLSSGYYMESFAVEVHQGSQPAFLNDDRHARLNEEIYLENADADFAMVSEDNPLVMKLGTHHLFVHPHEEVPEDMLAVPPRVEDSVDRTTDTQPVLIARKGRARQLAKLFGGP